MGPAVQLHIFFMYEIMHVFFLKTGRAGTKGAALTVEEQCAAHMKNKV